MGQLNIEISEPGFDIKSTSSYELSILVGMDSLLYLVVSENQQILLLKDYTLGRNNKTSEKEEALLQILNSDPVLPLLFKKVTIGFQSKLAALIPSRLYNEDNKSAYLKGLAEEHSVNNVLSSDISEVNAVMVYNLPERIHDRFKSLKPVAKYFHIGSPLILGGHKLATYQNDHLILVNIRDGQIQICLYEKRNLLLFNQNPFYTAKDAAYFLLLVFTQFKLNNEETPVWLSGQIVEDSELYTLFYRYIKNIHFVPSPDFLQFGKKFHPTPYHFYYDLFSLSLCK